MKKHYYLLSFTTSGGAVETQYLGVDQPRLTLADIFGAAETKERFLGHCTAACYLGEMTQAEFNNLRSR